jgi:hypothetical protein
MRTSKIGKEEKSSTKFTLVLSTASFTWLSKFSKVTVELVIGFVEREKANIMSSTYATPATRFTCIIMQRGLRTPKIGSVPGCSNKLEEEPLRNLKKSSRHQFRGTYPRRLHFGLIFSYGNGYDYLCAVMDSCLS